MLGGIFVLASWALLQVGIALCRSVQTSLWSEVCPLSITTDVTSSGTHSAQQEGTPCPVHAKSLQALYSQHWSLVQTPDGAVLGSPAHAKLILVSSPHHCGGLRGRDVQGSGGEALGDSCPVIFPEPLESHKASQPVPPANASMD